MTRAYNVAVLALSAATTSIVFAGCSGGSSPSQVVTVTATPTTKAATAQVAAQSTVHSAALPAVHTLHGSVNTTPSTSRSVKYSPASKE